MDTTEETTETITTNNYLLFIAIVLSVINAHLSKILNVIFSLLGKFTVSARYQELKYQLDELKKESVGTNMTDEFATYARIQRKIIKIQDELKKEASIQNNQDMKGKLIVRVVIGMCSIYLMYNYNSQPVVHLPSHTFYPISPLLSWPGGTPDSISFLVWCAITNMVVKTFS